MKPPSSKVYRSTDHVLYSHPQSLHSARHSLLSCTSQHSNSFLLHLAIAMQDVPSRTQRYFIQSLPNSVFSIIPQQQKQVSLDWKKHSLARQPTSTERNVLSYLTSKRRRNTRNTSRNACIACFGNGWASLLIRDCARRTSLVRFCIFGNPIIST